MSPTKTIDYVKSNFRVVKRVKNPLLNYFEVYKLSILINFVGLQNEKSDIQQKQTRLQHVSHFCFGHTVSLLLRSFITLAYVLSLG